MDQTDKIKSFTDLIAWQKGHQYETSRPAHRRFC